MKDSKEKFTLHHLALYGKGWYKRENKKTIWDDMKVIMNLSDYCGDVMDKFDIVGVILNNCQRLDYKPFNELSAFADGISRGHCWKHGYYTKDHPWAEPSFKNKKKNLPEYDYYEAILRYCISHLSGCDIKTLCGDGKMPKPDYTKGLPRKNGITDKKLKEMFGN